MKQSLIGLKRITGETKEDVINAVHHAMELAKFKRFIAGEKVFLKPNYLSKRLVPGQCTSPWVLEAVIQKLQGEKFKLVMGDTDVATVRQLDESTRLWGCKDLCKQYKVPFINLSKTKEARVKVGGKVFNELLLPEILLKVDSIVTIPVLKTHNITKITGALKNQWGCLPRVRHQYHLKAHHCIPDINKFLKVKFAVVDATICIEGEGPVTGEPKVLNTVYASGDLVAADALGAKIIGLQPEEVSYLKNAEQAGIGTASYIIKGDRPEYHKFRIGDTSNHPIVRWELRLRKVPGINHLLFNTPLFAIPAFFASRYNSVYWYYFKGRKHTKRILKEYPLYRAEFSPLLARAKLGK